MLVTVDTETSHLRRDATADDGSRAPIKYGPVARLAQDSMGVVVRHLLAIGKRFPLA